MTDALLEQFHAKMLGIYEAALSLKPPYRANLFKRMVDEHGGKEAADRLLATKDPSEGFTQLFLRGKDSLKLTVEYLVLQSPWCGLFTEEQLNVAKKRLRDVECKFPHE